MQEFSPEDKTLPDRPLECSECKKKIAVRYTEIAKGQKFETSMCNDCPELQKKLQGGSIEGQEHSIPGLTCGECGTTLSSIRVGTSLGCSHCYEFFSEPIAYEMMSMGVLPPNLNIENKSISLHVGRSPGEVIEVTHSLRLIALNEALKETLLREDYEQAALLRDQIKELSGEVNIEDMETKEENDEQQ